MKLRLSTVICNYNVSLTTAEVSLKIENILYGHTKTCDKFWNLR